MDARTQVPEPSPALAAYEHFAAYYDEFTAHHDYELWLGNLLPALRHHGLNGHRLLDVGCGTGKSFLPMLNRGWSVVGVDVSPAMLAQARRKLSARTRLEAHDMRELPVLGRFDLVWALDDAVNYLLSPEDLQRSLDRFRRNLAPAGLVAFDVNTLASYRGFFAETHRGTTADRKFVWQGRASTKASPGSEMTATFAVIGPGVDLSEGLHRQRHFTPAEVEDALAGAGLESLAIYGHGFDAVFEQPLDESRHTKAVVVARSRERR